MSTNSHAVIVETEARRCDRHGDYLTRRLRDHWTGCPKCSEESMARRDAEERELARQERIHRALGAAGVPARFEHAQFDTTLPAGLRAWAEAAIAGDTTGPAVLVGGVGTGKTHAACAVLMHLIRAGARGLFTTPGAFGRLIREQWQRRGAEESEASIVARYASAPVLVLDDLGAQRAIDAELLQDLICTRYADDRMRTTILTSNFAVAKFAEAIGERAADRIREGSMVIAMVGRSRRQPA